MGPPSLARHQQPAQQRACSLLWCRCWPAAKLRSPLGCHAQAEDEQAALQALEPARAAVAAQQHKGSSFSPHQRSAAQRAPFLLRFSAAWVHTAMLTTEVSMLEKRKQYQAAVDLLQQLLGAPPFTGIPGLSGLRQVQHSLPALCSSCAAMPTGGLQPGPCP